MNIRLILIIYFVMLAFTACGRTKENEKKDDNKSKENVENQTDNNDEDNNDDAEDEILVETEYGNYVMDAEWFSTQEISSGWEGLGFSHSYIKPDTGEISNIVSISYSIMPEEMDMSDHEGVINKLLENSQHTGPEMPTVSVEDYDSENHDEVFLFTYTNNQGEVINRWYVILKGQVQLSVYEVNSGLLYELPEQEQKEMNEASDRIAKRALESFQWID